MRALFSILILFMLFVNTSFAEPVTLSAGVSVEDVPDALFGAWRVTAKLDTTNSYSTFKPQSADMWNLSRTGDTITLNNPFTGANADISIKTIEGNLIVFSKKGTYDNKILTDTIAIRLEESSFSGINTLTLESYSLIDNHLLKTEQARYIIKGEKISGDNILKK